MVRSVAVISTGRAVTATPSLHQVRVNPIHVLSYEQTERQRQRQIGSIVDDDAPPDAWKWGGGIDFEASRG